MTNSEQKVYVCVAPNGLYWIGLADDVSRVWDIVFGWPGHGEIDAKKAAGWYVAVAEATWKQPGVE